MQQPTTEPVLIVGAGLAGLMAAHLLQKHGFQPLLVDKGRSVGGRLATRRIGPGRADHGAQFFTVRTPDFERWVDQWLKEGLVYRWSTGWSKGSLDAAEPDGYPRYAVKGGMNALAKHLAQDFTVQTNVRLTTVTPHNSTWQATAADGAVYSSPALLLTPPVPQSLALLEAGGVSLTEHDQHVLARIKYAPCVAGLYWVDGPVELPEPGAVQRPGKRISWIADNQRKGISPEARLITVHAGPDYSAELWNAPPNEALAALTNALSRLFAPETTIIEAQLKRWRYALPTSLHTERFYVAQALPPLVFAGDAFGEARVEGAALSGMAAARKLIDLLKNRAA